MWARLISAGLLLLCGCGSETQRSDAGVVDTGAATDAEPVTWSTQVVGLDGAPASEARVYSLDETQATLLGRTDETGRFEGDGDQPRLLIRSGFRAVEFVVAGEIQAVTRLAPTTLRRETLQLRGAGLEQQITDGGNLYFGLLDITQDRRFVYARRSGGTKVRQLVRIDVGARTEELLYETRNAAGDRRGLSWLGSRFLIARFEVRDPTTGSRSTIVVVWDKNEERLLGPFPLARSLAHKWVLDADTIHGVALSASGEAVVAHTAISVASSQAHTSTATLPSGPRPCELGVLGSQFVYRSGSDAFVYEVNEQRLRQLPQTRLSGEGCAGQNWLQGNAVTTAYFEGQELRFTSSAEPSVTAVWARPGLVPTAIEFPKAYVGGPTFAAVTMQGGETELVYVDPSTSVFSHVGTLWSSIRSSVLPTGPGWIENGRLVMLSRGSGADWNSLGLISIHLDGSDYQDEALLGPDWFNCDVLIEPRSPEEWRNPRWARCEDSFKYDHLDGYVDTREGRGTRTFFTVELGRDRPKVLLHQGRMVYLSSWKPTHGLELYSFDPEALK